MSQSVKHIEKIFVALDPKINQHQNNEYIIKKGGAEYNYQVINNNNIGPNSCTFNFNTPGINSFIDRCIWNKMTIDFHAKGTNATPGTNLLNIGVSDAPCFMPLRNRLYDTIALGLNAQTLTVYSSDIFPVLSRTNYHNKQRHFNQSLTTSQMQDQTQNFEDQWDPAYAYASQMSLANNPLGGYGQGGDGTTAGSSGRGSFKFISRTKISDDEEIIRYEFLEPLPISPCNDTDYWYEMAFCGINIITLNMTFNSTALARGSLWSHCNYSGNVLSSMVSTVVSSQLLLQIVNPPQTYIKYNGTLAYKYDKFDRYITPINQGVAIPPGGTVQGFSANSITISIYPSKFIVFARINPNTLDWNSTETYGAITNLTITLKSKNGILATFTPEMLYEMSVENGLKLTYTQWSRDVGSILCIPIEYCKLGDDEAAAVQEQLQVQMTCNIKNLNLSKSLIMDFVIIACNPGLFLVDQQTQKVDTEVGLVTKYDVINSDLAPHIDYHLARELYGADLVGDIKNFGHKLSILADKARPYAEKGYELAKEYGPGIAKNVVKYAPAALGLLGLGENEEDYELDGSGRKRRKRKPLRRRY